MITENAGNMYAGDSPDDAHFDLDLAGSLIQVSQDIIFRLNSEGVVVFINDNVRKYGLDPGEMTGSRLIDFIHPDDIENVKYNVNERRTGERRTRSVLLRFSTDNFNKDTRLYSNIAHPIFELSAEGLYNDRQKNGNVFLGTIGILKDVTGRTSAENALRDTEKQYRDLYEAAPVGLFRSRIRDGAILHANTAFAHILGFRTVEELLSNRSDSQNDDASRVRSHFIHELNLKGSFEDFELTVPVYGGAIKSVKISARIYPGKGYIEGVAVEKAAVATDRPQNREKWYKALFNVTNDAVLVYKNSKIVDCNESALELFNSDYEQLVTGESKESVSGEPSENNQVLEILAAEISKASEDGRDIFEWYYQSGSNPGIFAEVRLDNFQTGNTYYLAATIRDINERKLYEEQLLHLQKMESIGRLAGGLAHDFNNILSGIMGYSELLSGCFKEEGSQEREAVDIILQSVSRARFLTSQMLNFSRKGISESESIDVRIMLEEVINISEKIFQKKIDLVFEIEKGILNVIADKNQLHQVFTNLIINARDAMQKGGVLTVQAANIESDSEIPRELLKEGRRARKYVKISVGDNGMGMPDSVKNRIFEPFFTTKREGKGTGLGLSMVSTIIKNHGGIIQCDSVEGAGTVFDIYLPASNEKQIEIQLEEELAHGTESILVIDDEHNIRNMSMILLNDIGYNVYTASNGGEALDIMCQEDINIDLILLDMIIPGITCEELYAKLRGIDPAVKIIIMSGYSKNGKAQAILNSGANGFLQKPFKLSELSTYINKILNTD